MAGLFGNMMAPNMPGAGILGGVLGPASGVVQSPTILGMQPNDLSVILSGLKDAGAYFSGHPEQANALLPAMTQAQQYRTLQSILAPDTSTPAQRQGVAPMTAGASGQTGAPSPQGGGADYGDLNAAARGLYDQIPHIPGMPARQALNFYLQNPTAYLGAAVKQYDMTDLEKNTGAAYGQGTPEQRAMLQGTLAKGAAVNIRPGGGALNYADNSIITMPGQNGVQTTFPNGASGPAQMQMVPGAFDALTQAGVAQGLGKAATTPAIGYDTASNRPVATNQAQMLGASNLPPLGLRSNNPGNLQPGGREASYGTPTEGILAAASNLDNYAAKGVNTINGIVSTWAPASGGNNSQAYANFVAQKLGVDPNKPLDLRNPQVKGRVLDAMFAFENGPKAMQAVGSQGAQPLLPELPKGTPEYLGAQGKDAGERHDATVAAAAESPMRINVLDNILNLSEQGTKTGPGQQWQNAVLGYAANTPLLSKVMGGAKDNVAKFQELQKFMYQNALRNWQAAGGTGTDAQMESMQHANPNDTLFPQALQQIAKWGKASELAVQGKANAQDQYLAQSGNNPGAQIKFESTWRNAFDPKVFQYSLMTPQEKQTFAAQLKTPQAARAFLAKQQQLQQMGALQ